MNIGSNNPGIKTMFSCFDVRPYPVQDHQISGSYFLCNHETCDYGKNDMREKAYSQNAFIHDDIKYLHWGGLCLNCIDDAVKDMNMTEID